MQWTVDSGEVVKFLFLVSEYALLRNPYEDGDGGDGEIMGMGKVGDYGKKVDMEMYVEEEGDILNDFRSCSLSCLSRPHG